MFAPDRHSRTLDAENAHVGTKCDKANISGQDCLQVVSEFDKVDKQHTLRQ